MIIKAIPHSTKNIQMFPDRFSSKLKKHWKIKPSALRNITKYEYTKYISIVLKSKKKKSFHFHIMLNDINCKWWYWKMNACNSVIFLKEIRSNRVHIRLKHPNYNAFRLVWIVHIRIFTVLELIKVNPSSAILHLFQLLVYVLIYHQVRKINVV